MFHKRSVVTGVVIFTDEHRDVIYFIVFLSAKASFHSKHAWAAISRAQGHDERDLYFVSITKDINAWIPVSILWCISASSI
jgi:hypothetical protein